MTVTFKQTPATAGLVECATCKVPFKRDHSSHCDKCRAERVETAKVIVQKFLRAMDNDADRHEVVRAAGEMACIDCGDVAGWRCLCTRDW
jgi:hypothetical protein